MIKQLESFLNPTPYYLQLFELGHLIPRYKFSNEKRELSILFEFDDKTTKSKFIEFKIAKFDFETISSFKSNLLSDNLPFNPSEFLIQAMYGFLASPKLGLPGKDTVLIPEIKQIAPSEIPFIGLYNLLKKYPDRMLDYRSQCIGPETPESQFLSRGLVYPELQEGYVKVISSIEKKKKEKIFNEKEEQIKKSYNLLVLLIALHFDFKYDTIIEKLENDLKIFSPEKIDILFAGEGYNTSLEFEEKIKELIDYEGEINCSVISKQLTIESKRVSQKFRYTKAKYL